MTLSAAFELFMQDREVNGASPKTIVNYLGTLHSILKTTTDIPVHLLTLEHVQRWTIYRRELGHADTTISHDLSRLKQVLRFLRKRGFNVLDEDDIDLPKLKERQYTWLDYSEVQSILDVISSKRDKALIACLWSSGSRIGALLSLRRSDLHGSEAQAIGKGGRIVTLRFDDQAMQYLNDYLETRKDPLTPLFITSQRRCITQSRVNQLIHEYSDLAGIDKNVTAHVFRHSFATDLRLNGADILDIQEQLDHKRLSSTQIYVHINDDRKKQVFNKYHSTKH